MTVEHFRSGDQLSPATGVRITADWVHPDNGHAAGSYFSFNPSVWANIFGNAATNSAVYGVEHRRDGRIIWTGDVIVWSKDWGWSGRTNPMSYEHFRNGDQLSASDITRCNSLGVVRMPLNMVGEEQTVETPGECQQRCKDTPGCKYFNSFEDGGCHITTGAEGTRAYHGIPTKMSGSTSCTI